MIITIRILSQHKNGHVIKKARHNKYVKFVHLREEFEGIWSVYGVENCKIVSLGAFPIHLFRHFWCRMYRLATIHFVTDRRQYHANTQSSGTAVRQYDRLKCMTVKVERDRATKPSEDERYR